MVSVGKNLLAFRLIMGKESGARSMKSVIMEFIKVEKDNGTDTYNMEILKVYKEIVDSIDDITNKLLSIVKVFSKITIPALIAIIGIKTTNLLILSIKNLIYNIVINFRTKDEVLKKAQDVME
jgi:hypothetical protein